MADWDIVSQAPLSQGGITATIDTPPVTPRPRRNPLDDLDPELRPIFQRESRFKPFVGYTPPGTPEVDLSKAPLNENGFPIWEGRIDPKTGLRSHAAGLGQIQPDTWNPIAKKLGIKDFSEGSQVRVANELKKERGLKPWEASAPSPWQVVGKGGWNVSSSAISAEQERNDTSVVYMTPADYLALTPEVQEGEGKGRSALAKSLGAGDEIQSIPTLDVKPDGKKLTVYDQDGRNRAMAAEKAGVDLIPVSIRGVPKGEAPERIIGMRGGEGRPFDYRPVPQAGGARSTIKGIGEGLMDPVYGTMQFAQHIIPKGVADFAGRVEGAMDRLTGAAPQEPADMDKVVRDREAQIAAERGPNAGFDWSRAGGNLLSNLALGAALPGSTIPRMAASGAVAGAMEPVTGNADFGQQKLAQAALGGATAGAVGVGGNALARLVSPMPLRAAAQTLVDEGVRLTPGQMMGGAARRVEDAAGSIPIVGAAVRAGQRRAVDDFNRAAWNRVLAPLGEKLPPSVRAGEDAMNYASDRISQTYNRIIPNLKGTADQQFMTEWGGILNDARLPDQQLAQLNRLFDTQFVQKSAAHPLGQGMSGDELLGIDEMLSREAAGYKTDPLFDYRKLGGAIEDLHLAFRGLLERQNPNFAQPLRDAREAYANYLRAGRAASSLGAKDGVFTAAQLANAVRAMDPSMRKFAFGKGNALMQDLSDAGEAVLPRIVPDSGTAERAGLLGLLGGGAAISPGMALGGAAMSLPYTSPGMNILRSYLTAFPNARRMFAEVPRLAGRLGGVPGAAVATQPGGPSYSEGGMTYRMPGQ